jgi:hypothetical protein
MMIMQRTRCVKEMKNREKVVDPLVSHVVGKRRHSEEPEV